MQSLELRRSPTADYGATVQSSVLLTPTIKALRLRLEGDEFRFLPGQSVWTKFERDGRTFTKIYSIASSPSQCPEVELCISRVGWSSSLMHELQVGQSLRVRAPYGLMTLKTLPDRPRLYIAEGSGIAPLKSQIDWLHESGFQHPVWLLQANPETPAALPYQEHWRSLAHSWARFHYHPAIAPEETLASLGLELREMNVEICAVGDRTEQIHTAVLALGAELDQVRSEKFIAF
ncbi:MAG TPA: FAD-binding oxidoreductase [Thermosynechococcaceae cyanobacterium]